MTILQNLEESNLAIYIQGISKRPSFEITNKYIDKTNNFLEYLMLEINVIDEVLDYTIIREVEIAINDIHYENIKLDHSYTVTIGDTLNIDLTLGIPLPINVINGNKNEKYLTPKTYEYVRLYRTFNHQDDFKMLHDHLLDQRCEDEYLLEHIKNWILHPNGCTMLENILRKC